MTKVLKLSAMLLCGALFFACGSEKEAPKTTTPAKPSTPAVNPPAAPADGCGCACACGCGCGCGEEATSVVDQAKAMLDDALGKIKEKKYDDAKGILAKLSDMKAQLPADLQKKIDDAMAAVKAGDLVGGLGIGK